MKPMVKAFIVMVLTANLVFLLASFATTKASESIYPERVYSKDGSILIRLVNATSSQVYCSVSYNNGYGFFDFYINPHSASRWYYEPQGYYEWRCT